MWKIFRCQHQSKACTSGDVPFPVRLHVLSSIDCACFLRPNVEVVPKPGKEHEEGILFRKTVIDNCNCSGGPKQGAQQCDFHTKKLLHKRKNYTGRQGPKDNIWEADCKFVGHGPGPANSTMPTVRARPSSRNHRFPH